MNILPKINSICKFEFISKFSGIDGVYKVVKIMTYEQAQLDEVDFAESLYTPSGIDPEQYSIDFDEYRSDQVIELHSITGDIVYVFSSILKGVPNPTVKVYDYIVFGATVGYFRSPLDYEWLATSIEDILRTKLGSDTTVSFIADPDKKKWMTDEEYNVIDNERSVNIKNEPSAYLKISQLQNENTRLKNIISMYEALLTKKGK